MNQMVTARRASRSNAHRSCDQIDSSKPFRDAAALEMRYRSAAVDRVLKGHQRPWQSLVPLCELRAVLHVGCIAGFAPYDWHFASSSIALRRAISVWLAQPARASTRMRSDIAHLLNMDLAGASNLSA
jgi:hypothetical protein